MPTTTLVTATRYNLLKNRIHTILGTSLVSTPTSGYGQSTYSSGVTGNYNTNTTATDLIDDQDYREIYIDLVRARVHQIGSAAFTQQPTPLGNFSANGAATDKVAEAYIAGLESLMTSIETDKLSIFESTQATLENLRNSLGTTIQGSRFESISGTWNSTLSFIFTVSFTSAEERRHFFNAGGKIRITASKTGADVNPKTASWRTLLSGLGQIIFNHNSTTNSASFGTGSAIGNYGLTSSYQLIYRGYSSAYFSNAVEVYALQLNSSQIQFRVYLADQRSENIDEQVFGDFFVSPTILRPEGTVSINGTVYPTLQITTAPVGAIITNLTAI